MEGWREAAKLTVPDGSGEINFGWWVAASAETVVVGAPADPPGINSGSVYLYVARLGGTASGLEARRATCRNEVSGQTVEVDLQQKEGASWDCEGAGLAVGAGDPVTLQVAGRALGRGLGGAVSGARGRKVVTCANPETGEAVELGLGPQTTWDCTTAGLVVNPGDRILQTIRGTAE